MGSWLITHTYFSAIVLSHAQIGNNNVIRTSKNVIAHDDESGFADAGTYLDEDSVSSASEKSASEKSTSKDEVSAMDLINELEYKALSPK